MARESPERRVEQLLNQNKELNKVYSRNDRRAIIAQSKQLFTRFPTLASVEVEKFVYNDGSSSPILCVRGVLPIVHSGNSYNIPLALYLPPAFPSCLPFAYVEPVAGMTVASRSCQFVDANGLVCTPALIRWQAKHSSLTLVASEMSQLFGSEPPVYAQPSASELPRPPSQQEHPQPDGFSHPRMPHQHSKSTSALSQHPTSNGSNGFCYQHPQEPPMPHGGASLHHQPKDLHHDRDRSWPGFAAANGHAGSSMSASSSQPALDDTLRPQRRDPGYTFKDCALQALRRRFRERLICAEEHMRSQYSDIDSERLLQEREELQRRRDALQAEASQAQHGQEATEMLASTAEDASRRLSAWLVTNETDAPGEVDGKRALEPASTDAARRAGAKARVNACEDSIRALDRCLREGSVTLTRYVSSVQALAREQFQAKHSLQRERESLDGVA